MYADGMEGLKSKIAVRLTAKKRKKMVEEIIDSIKEGVRKSLNVVSKDEQEKTEREIKRLKRQIKAQTWKRARQ